MIGTMEGLMDQYDRGTLSRRELLSAMLLLAVPSGLAAQSPAKPIAPGLTLNHVHLYVLDVDKSIAFYGDLLGAKVRDTSPDNATLTLPGKSSWISLTKTKDPKATINHVGYGINLNTAKGDAARLAKEINDKYPESKAKPTGPTVSGPNTRSVYLYDPSGIYLQIVPKEDDGWLPTGPVGSKILKGEKA